MKIHDLINVDTLHDAGFDKVREVHISQGEDYDGDESFFIWLLLDEQLPEDQLRWKTIEPMSRWAYARAWEFGDEKIIPYVRVRRESEWPVGMVEVED